MAITFNTYTGLLPAVKQWMGRSTDTLIDDQFDNILALAERRIYYGFATDDMVNPMRSDPLRIPEMEATVESTDVAQGDDTLAQPDDFLELISVYNNTIPNPMQIVAQRVIDQYAGRSVGGTKLISVSGTNFRIWDSAPADLELIMHYFKKLTTPSPEASNDILTNYPDVYLYGCLVEAAIMTQDQGGALAYLQLYNASVAGLNARAQRQSASANPIIRIASGMVP